jgi:hypothetical protein
VRVNFEAPRMSGLNRYATASDRHEANALAVVWRFNPEWEVGARIDWLRVRMPHGDHFHWGLLRERALMLAWKPSHMQSLRLQVSSSATPWVRDAARAACSCSTCWQLRGAWCAFVLARLAAGRAALAGALAITVFACEPEWAALARELLPAPPCTVATHAGRTRTTSRPGRR